MVSLNSDSTKTRLISGSFWSLLEKGWLEFLSFVLFLVLARLLQPEDYGAVALALVFVTLMSAISTLGISAALVQIERLDDRHLSTAFWASLALSLAFFALFYVGAPLVASAVTEPLLAQVLPALAVVGVLQATDAVPRALLTRHFRFRYLALRSISSTFIGGAIGIALAAHGYGVWALVAQQVSTALVRAIITWAGLGWTPGFDVGLAPLRKLLYVGTYVLGSTLSNIVSRQSDKLLIGAVLNTRELGVYGIGFRVSQTANDVLLHSLSRLGLPTFSRLQKEPKALEEAYTRLLTMGMAGTLPIFMMVALTASELVPFLFGSQWRDSAAVLQILMLASCCQALVNFDGPLLVACGKAQRVFKLMLIRALLSFTAFAVAVHWGINAVAGALAAVAVIMLPLWKSSVARNTALAGMLPAKQFASITVALAAMVCTALLLVPLLADVPVPIFVACQWIGGLLVYVGCACALDNTLRGALSGLLESLSGR